jgi:putative transferase (TIGR04331 family)
MHAFAPWDTYAEHRKYLSQQFRFVAALDLDIRSELLIRLHSDVHKMPYCETALWSEKYPDVALDNGQKKLPNLIRGSRLVVFSYDSTGIIEMLATNQPFICFWQDRWAHLVESAIPYYEYLEAVGIFHSSPESAAFKIKEIWGDIASWWYSPEVQLAREIFCDQYSHQTSSPVSDLANLMSARAAEISAHSMHYSTTKK